MMSWSGTPRVSWLVFSPFWEMTKGDIVKWFLDEVGNVDALHQTVGCYHASIHQCGRCGSCFRKWVAFKVNGIEPTFEILNEIKTEYRARAMSGHYNERRNQEILAAFGDNP